jgi:O-6-methylguanine DNA methyltransferase
MGESTVRRRIADIGVMRSSGAAKNHGDRRFADCHYRIPPGSTISYGELAGRIGRPTAVRAVGLANGSNPVGIVVPCHRVIGSNGKLAGYGGGLHPKGWLLQHEAQWRDAFLVGHKHPRDRACAEGDS